MPSIRSAFCFRLGRRFDEDHARLFGMLLEPPFAAAAGMDLRFDDGDFPAEFLERLGGIVGRLRDAAPRNGNPRIGQQLFRLILVNLHSVIPMAAELNRRKPRQKKASQTGPQKARV